MGKKVKQNSIEEYFKKINKIVQSNEGVVGIVDFQFDKDSQIFNEWFGKHKTDIINPVMSNNFNSCNAEKKQMNKIFNFILGCGKDTWKKFLKHKTIDGYDKISAIIVKYALISTLPDEFKDFREKEIKLFDKNLNSVNSVLEKYSKYINIDNNIGTNHIFINCIYSIIDHTFYENGRIENFNFLEKIFNKLPDLINRDEVNFQGQPIINRISRLFLENSSKTNEEYNKKILNFISNSISKNPSLIYRYSTTNDTQKRNYDKIKDNLRRENYENIKLNNDERSEKTLLAEFLVALRKNDDTQSKFKDNIFELLYNSLALLCDQTESLKNKKDSEELREMSFLLNQSLIDPNTKESKTPMDLLKTLTEKQNNKISSKIRILKEPPISMMTKNEIENKRNQTIVHSV